MTVFRSIWDWISGFLKGALDFAVSALPDSPFRMIDNSVVKPYLGYFNWVFPINEIIITLEAWLVAIGIFYTLQAILRWVKAIN